MSKSNILDTLVIADSKIVFKKFHIARTKEAFQFLDINPDLNFHRNIELIYDTIERTYTEKMPNDECLRILFSTYAPLSYKVEIKKIEKLNPIVRLSTIKLKKQLPADSAFKWENREFWNLMLKDKTPEADDILLISTHNEIIETSRFNVFCYDKTTQCAYTPELESGCLNGVFRRFALNESSIQLPNLGNKKLIEKKIKFDELDRYQLFVANSVRGPCLASLI